MPDDCILAFDLKGKADEMGRNEIYDLYSQTDYVGNLGKTGNGERMEPLAKFNEISEDLGLSNDIAEIGGTAFDLFA